MTRFLLCDKVLGRLFPYKKDSREEIAVTGEASDRVTMVRRLNYREPVDSYFEELKKDEERLSRECIVPSRGREFNVEKIHFWLKELISRAADLLYEEDVDWAWRKCWEWSESLNNMMALLRAEDPSTEILEELDFSPRMPDIKVDRAKLRRKRDELKCVHCERHPDECEV